MSEANTNIYRLTIITRINTAITDHRTKVTGILIQNKNIFIIQNTIIFQIFILLFHIVLTHI